MRKGGETEYTDSFVHYSAIRGHSQKLFKQRFSLTLRANSFSSRVVNTWNSLSESAVTVPFLNTFKNRLNIHKKRHPQ